MSVIGNILWIICGGWLTALLWCFFGALACISIIGLPWGRACFVMAGFAFLPFGYESISREVEGEDPEEMPARSRYLRHVPDNVEIFDVQGPFFFGAVEQFKDRVFRNLSREVDYVLLRMRLVPALDASGLHALEDFLAYCQRRDVTLLLCGVQKQPMKVIRRDSPFMSELHAENICENIDTALERISQLEQEKEQAIFQQLPQS